MNKVILVGTAHTIQRNRDRSDFDEYVVDLIKKHGIVVIAEEIDVESVALDIAKRLNLDYLNIEPTLQEREDLGIPSLAMMEASIIWEFDDLESDEAQAKLTVMKESSYRAREREWSKRIKDSNQFPSIVICGSDHFQAFGDLLRNRGMEVIEESPSWE